ncbi:uncharacterized protein rab44 isoform X4 [Sebastes umbrosus]|uniref:uncharacterized protein rab44 isoform X4 n=1 Tax=Sebastes umbrosus TaxID=72105 RepID=UPI00189D805E|nr:uncharacterized protein rab44 isoform X4 [Sebastes umbrosus]
MSAQSAKKKRIGSRRRVANQNEISKADEFHVGDSTSVAESHIPEEHTESLNVLGHFDNSQSESQHPPSPELSGGRRKLGSSRRLKGRHVKDSVTESYHEAREEVEDKTREKETTVSKQTPLAIQPERQEALSQGSEHDDMSATPEYSSEIQKTTTTNYPEADLESLIPKGRNLPTDLDENENDSEVVSDSCKLAETTQEGNDISILHSEKVKESAHPVGISELTSLSALSCPTVDQQLIDQSNFKEMPEEKLPSVCSVTEKEGKERDDDTESFRHDGNLQGSYLVSESHVESVVMQFSTTPEITTEKISPKENTEVECSVGQATILSPKEELPTDEEQNEHFNLSEVRGAHHSEDDVNKQHEQEIRLTEKHMPHDDTENSEIISGNLTDQTEVSDTYQSELTEKSTDGSPTNQDISYPEDKRDEHLTDENNFEALEQKNEDYHVYDTTEPQISDIERVDSALGQVYEIEGRVEDDIKPGAEQTAHQEKEGLFSEVEESESSLLTVQSEINATLDSQPQQDDTSFNPIGNRRKLGSSRRNRGRRHVKDSAAESDHEHKEDAESTSGNEAIETAQMLLATERTSQEELSQGSEHDVIPETHDSSLYSATVTDYSSEVQSPTTTNYPEADLESLIPESENLQKDHDERETHFKVEVSDKSVGATLEGSDKSDSLQGQEVKDQHPSEDAVNKEHEHEVKPTENQEMPQIDKSSESVIRDATENSEIISGNLTDQTEVSDTYQSELTEKSTDGSPTNQDISYPEDKQDEHPTDENNFEALEQKNEDYHVYDTKEPQISDIERVDSALGQVYEIEGRVEDDIKPSAEQTAHQEKEGLFSKVEERESSLLTVQSEINATLDSQPQQDDISFNPIGNRRKLGSSRRNRGRRHVKDSAAESDHEHKEDVESTRGNEAIETAQMLLATERTSQEQLSQGTEHDVIPETHDISLYSATMTDYSSEVQSPTTTNYPEADLESLIPESENLQEDHDDRETHFKVEVSDKPVGATLEGSDKSDSLQGQEVKGQHHSEDAVNKEHEQEVKPTENQEMPQIDNSSESVIRDEVSDTYQSELTEKSTDGSPTNQDISYPEDKQDEHPTDENNFEALEQKNEDYHVYDTKEPQISDIERVDTAPGQVYEIEGRVEDDIKPGAEQTAHQEKEGLFSEVEESESSLQTMQSEINATLDSRPQQDDTSFNPIGNRRKLGSSRRNRGRQHVKDSAAESDHEHKEDVESTRGNEAIETAQILATERTSQEELSQGSEHDVIPETHDSSLYSATVTDYSSEVQSPTTTNYPEADLESLIPESENLQEDHDERETHFKVEVSDKSVGATLEGADKSDSLQGQEVKGEHHSEDAVNKEHEHKVKPTENQEMPQIHNSSENVMHDATENSEIISGNLTDQTEVSDTYQSELAEKSTDGSPTNQDISYPDDKQDEHPTKEVLYEIEGRVEDDIKPSAEQTAHPEKEGLFSEVEESGSSLLTVQSEINAPLDSQPQQDDTSFNPIGNRRKLGSSRRHRGRRHVKDSAAESDHEPTEDVVGNTRDNEPLEITEMSLTIETAVQEKSMETMLEGMDTFDTPQTEDVSDQVKENAYVGTVVGIDLHSSTTVDQQMIDQSNFRDIPDEELLNVSSVTEKENKERDEDTELFRQVGHLQTNYLVSEDIESSITPEITTEQHSSREHTQPEYSVEQAIFSSPEEELPTNEEQNEIFNLPEVKGQHHSEDAVNKEHEQEVKPTENQEMPQIDKSQPQQDDTSFNPIGNRRKLGSSRRHRGRRHVMDSAAESDHEPTEDVVGNTRDNEPLEITEMSLTMETAVQEKSMETMLEGMDTFDTPQTEDVSDQVKHVGTQERDEDTESVRRDENLQTNYLVSETQAKSEDIESSISPEVSSENSSPGEHTEIECSVEQAAFSSSKEELSTNEERTEHVSLGARPSEDAVNKVHEEAIKPIQMQEMPQIDNSSIKDSELTLQTMQSEHFDPQHLDNSQSIKEQTHTGFSPKGHRRKLGSSRRQKGRLHVEDTTKMSLPMETMRQEELKEQTDLDFKFAGEIRSTVNNEGNTEKMLEEDTIVATDMTSSSGKDDFVKSNEEVNEEECKLIKETENLSQLRCDTVKMDLIQSLDVSATAVNMQQTNDTPENVGDVTKQDYETEAESSMHVQVYGLDEDGEQFEDTTKKDHEAHEMNVSPEITHAERFSAPHDKTDTLAPFDVGLEENIQAEPAVAVSEESGISSQQGIQEQANLDDGENLQGGSKQKRRKLGSTRRTQLNRKPEEKTVETKDLNADADMRSLDKMEVVEELTMTVTAEGSQNENAKPSQSPEDKEQQETISKAFFPEQSASHNEEVVNPVKFVHIADVRDNERNVEPSQIDDFTATEMHISDLLSANTEDSTGTGITDRGFVSSWGTTQSTRGDEERPESVNITQDQSLKSAEVPVVADFEIVKAAVRGGAAEEHTNAQASKQEPDDADEGAHNKHLEMKNASPNLDSTNRKRKMGSSRRNLVSRTKREDLNQKQEVDDEATETETNVGDVKTVSFSGNVEDEPQLHTEHKDSEQREESETVAYSHTDEENPVSHGQLVETEHQLTPSYLPSTPSTSPKHDSMSESSPGGRRRKMGSHRKSHGHQNNENQTAGGDRKTDNERDVRSITDESAIKTTEEPNERPLGLDKISEVDQSDKKPSSNISTAKSEKTPEPGTPVQRPYAEIVLGQESQHKFSLAGDSRGADLRANAFNVMMVGDSSVGKSSFMKRAQSGKFSLEIPASIGLDSCMWTVLVDGKPVVLQLWDTAGQERFHSITRQIFHKAHAFLLMYDITSSQSFSAVSYWANCIQEGASENVTILLAGNKCDHAERQVNTEKAEALAKEYNFEFMECSAATGENVVHCLETVARMLSQKIDTREEDLVLHKEPQQRKSGCC